MIIIISSSSNRQFREETVVNLEVCSRSPHIKAVVNPESRAALQLNFTFAQASLAFNFQPSF